MQQVKIFECLENEIAEMESNINRWLRESGARIVSITGNIAPQSQPASSKAGGLTQGTYPPSDVVLIVLYETASA